MSIRAIVVAVLVAGCLSDDSSQQASREKATAATCSKYDQCGEVGAGKTYETRSSCEVQQASNWEHLWPPAECDGKVDSSALQMCLDAINAIECGNTFDIANVYLNKCPKMKVCNGP